MIIRITSVVQIRNISRGVGVLELPHGLNYYIGRFDEQLIIQPLTFIPQTKNDINGFVKERGEFALNDMIFHFEIISFICWNKKHPIIFRMWNIEQFKFYAREFLIWAGIRNLYSILFNQKLTWTILNAIFLNVGYNYPGDFDDPFAYQAIGCLMDYQHLIPNMTPCEYNSVVNSLPINTFSLEDPTNAFIKMIYGEYFTAQMVHSIIGMIEGNFPIQPKPVQNIPESLAIDCCNIHMSMSQKEYNGLIVLRKIPYDEFDIEISLERNQVIYHSIYSSAGVEFPFLYDKISNDISFILNEFTYQYFTLYSDEGSIRYFDANNREIKTIHIVRTNNEVVSIDFLDDTTVYTKKYDMLLLSIISPIIT